MDCVCSIPAVGGNGATQFDAVSLTQPLRSMTRIQTRPKCRWYQLRLRTLLVILLLAALAAWYVGRRMERLEFEKRQREAVALLSSRMGSPIHASVTQLKLPRGLDAAEVRYVAFLPQLEQLSIQGGGGEYNARRLRCLRHLPSLKYLELHGTVTGDGFAELGSLSRLEKLDLFVAPTDEFALQRLSELRKLKTLSISLPMNGYGTRHLAQLTELESLRIISSGGLFPVNFEFLANMPKLRVFWLQCSIHGDPLRHLEHMPELTEVRLQANQLTDGDVAHLKNCSRLKHLTLESNSGNFVTDEGLAVVARLPNLQFLNVSNCRSITDVGLRHVKDLKKLRTLRVSGTSISDEGLQHFYGLKNLVNLNLNHTSVTADGVKKLGALLPKLRTLKLPPTMTKESIAELRQSFPEVVID